MRQDAARIYLENGAIFDDAGDRRLFGLVLDRQKPRRKPTEYPR